MDDVVHDDRMEAISSKKRNFRIYVIFIAFFIVAYLIYLCALGMAAFKTVTVPLDYVKISKFHLSGLDSDEAVLSGCLKLPSRSLSFLLDADVRDFKCEIAAEKVCLIEINLGKASFDGSTLDFHDLKIRSPSQASLLDSLLEQLQNPKKSTNIRFEVSFQVFTTSLLLPVWKTITYDQTFKSDEVWCCLKEKLLEYVLGEDIREMLVPENFVNLESVKIISSEHALDTAIEAELNIMIEMIEDLKVLIPETMIEFYCNFSNDFLAYIHIPSVELTSHGPSIIVRAGVKEASKEGIKELLTRIMRRTDFTVRMKTVGVPLVGGLLDVNSAISTRSLREATPFYDPIIECVAHLELEYSHGQFDIERDNINFDVHRSEVNSAESITVATMKISRRLLTAMFGIDFDKISVQLPPISGSIWNGPVQDGTIMLTVSKFGLGADPVEVLLESRISQRLLSSETVLMEPKWIGFRAEGNDLVSFISQQVPVVLTIFDAIPGLRLEGHPEDSRLLDLSLPIKVATEALYVISSWKRPDEIALARAKNQSAYEEAYASFKKACLSGPSEKLKAFTDLVFTAVIPELAVYFPLGMARAGRKLGDALRSAKSYLF